MTETIGITLCNRAIGWNNLYRWYNPFNYKTYHEIERDNGSDTRKGVANYLYNVVLSVKDEYLKAHNYVPTQADISACVDEIYEDETLNDNINDAYERLLVTILEIDV